LFEIIGKNLAAFANGYIRGGIIKKGRYYSIPPTAFVSTLDTTNEDKMDKITKKNISERDTQILNESEGEQMIYELGAGGMKRIDVEANNAKNTLKPGRVLQLEGYSNPRYVIIRNEGISERFQEYGAHYVTVNLEDFTQHTKQALTMKFLAEKKHGGIQMYITDEMIEGDELLAIWEKSETKRRNDTAAQAAAVAMADHMEAKGRALFAKYIPADAAALIVAEADIDESDSQTDLFAHRTAGTVILGYSKHNKDLFSEMRKFAAMIPETAHLATGCGHFEPRVQVVEADRSRVPDYTRFSQWHSELTRGADGRQAVYTTRAAADAHIAAAGAPAPINFEGVGQVNFEWTIQEDEIEHREKYSMGAGYYLKDGGSHSTGWNVHKVRNGHDCGRDLYIAMAKRCIFGK
jgi:hypothetical protein